MKSDLRLPFSEHWTPESLGDAVQRPLDLLAYEIGCVFWLTGPDGRRLLYVTPSCEQMWGTPPHVLYENPLALLECVHPDDRARTATAMTLGSGDAPLEYRVVRPDGSVRWIMERMREVRDLNGQLAYFGGLASDITESKRAEASLRRHNRALRVVGAISKTLIKAGSEDRLADEVCKALLETGGYSSAWIGFQLTAHAISPLALKAVQTGRPQVCHQGSTDPQTDASPVGARASAPTACIFVPLIDEAGVLGIMSVESTEEDAFDADEVSLLEELAARVSFGIALQRSNLEHDRAVARADRLTLFDALTELPNRIQLLQDIHFTAERCESACSGFSVLAIDVPRIETLKGSLGFGASDTLVMTLAARLKDFCSEQEIAARLEGGEFAVRLEPEGSADVHAALARARAIRAALEVPCLIGATEIVPHCVIGIAMYPTDGKDGQILLERAQTARMSTSGGWSGDISFYGPQKSTHVMRELGLESALRQAISANELRLLYQPAVDLSSGEIVSVEALLRWRSEQFGEVAPAEFIPLAERSALIHSIGEWVLRETCRQAAAWRACGLAAPRIALNLSSRQLEQPGFAAQAQQIALECGADPSWLGLEITESMLIEDSDHVCDALRQLKAIGFEILLDDFGTGYSSLSRLQDMPIDIVKIDRRFIPDVTAAPEEVSVTRAVITMARSLQMRVLAEGVETEGQLSLLAAHGCDLVQGYFFSRPVTAAVVETMVREKRRLPQKFLTRSTGGRTLLLVDDEENILSSLKRLLRRDGYQIICARSAAEGLQRLAESQVDVIVSDQRMPGMTGVEFLRRAKDLYPDTVRMVLSGFTDLQSIIDAVNEGAIYKFLTKPWDDGRIRGHIGEAFRQKEMADENRRLTREVESANGRLEQLNQQLQQSLQQQNDQSSILQRSADSAREVLDGLPVAIIGIDPEGLIAFVGGAASEIVPQLSCLIGRAAATALPPGLVRLLQDNPASAGHVDCDDRRFHAVVRTLNVSGALRGRLMVLIPIDSTGRQM
jgi:diguanylate cyclase (GGDEF)-like protein/PAS domain S-box-containing protein